MPWEQRQYTGEAHTASVSWPQPEIMETSDNQHPWQQGQPSRAELCSAQVLALPLPALHSAAGCPVGQQSCSICRQWCAAGLQSEATG